MLLSVKAHVTIAVVLTLAVVAPLAQGQDDQVSSQPDAEKAVLARLAEIQDAAQALDAEKVFSYVLENDKGALVQGGKLYLTRDEALATTKQGLRGLEKVEYRFDQQHVVFPSPTVALATGEGVTTAVTATGRTITAGFAQSVVLVLKGGRWKVFHAHRSFPSEK